MADNKQQQGQADTTQQAQQTAPRASRIPVRLMVQAFSNGQWRDVDQVPLTARGPERPFSTGKLGYNGNDKLMLPSLADGADGELRQHQFTANIIEIKKD
jgi:hypothetical protein